MGKRRPDTCPSCGASGVQPIVYAYPDESLREAEQRGEVQIGGCVVDLENPEWHCTACEHEWRTGS